MKKFFLVAMTLILGVSVMAQQKIQLRSVDKAECVKSDMTSLKANFSFSSLDASIVETTRGELSELHIEGAYPNGNVGEPQLPMFTRLIAIPTGASPVVTVGAHSETQYTLSDYGIGIVSAMQAPIHKNVDPSTVEYAFNEAAYARDSYNDDPIAMVEVLGTMRGITLGRLIVQPVRYNPVAGTVKVFNDIEVNVEFQNGDAESTAQMFKNTCSPAFRSVYDQIFNIDMLQGRSTRDAYTDHPDMYNTPVKMLVICYSGFQGNAALNNWLQWKLQKGYYVDIYYTSETGTTASSIASFIKTKYNASVSAGNAYTYLIVIGDTGQVPQYMNKNIDSDIGNCASDLGYSSVNFSSNTSNYFPDMYYSRISVENTTHLTNYINKVLTYEKYEFTDGGNYLNNVILVGGWDSNWTSRVAKPTINYGTNYYFNSSNTTYGGFSGGTINATISTSSTAGYSGTNNGCYNGINNGVCFLNYTAHGDKQEWYQPKMTAAHVATLTNTGKYFFAVGNCCLTGNFNNTTTTYSPGSSIGTNACFAETMIRVPNAGAIAYVGCSPYSYWYEDFYWAVGAHSYSQGNYPTTTASSKGVYDVMFMDQYWNSASALNYVGNLAVQQAVTNGNTNSSITDGNCNNSAHYYFQFYHTFGDGSVMPYVTKPEANTVTIPSTVTPGTTSITVNAVAGSYVAVTDNSSVIYGVAEANSSGVATVNFTNAIPGSGTLYVVVTRQQYQPYFGTIQIVGGTQYNITVTQPQHGTISAPSQAYANSTVTLTATPETGYCLSSWTVRAGNQNITVTNNQFTMPESNVTVTATFVQGLAVTLAPVTNGSISADPLYALQGTTINLTATPAEGYEFGSWTVYKTGDANTTVTVNGNSFTMPNYPVTVSANFVLGPTELTVYNGTATNQYIPMYGYYFDNYTKSECIIPASQLTAMNGCTISAITFYPSSVATTSSTWTGTSQTVFLKEVSGTTLGGSFSGTSGATTVKQGLLEMPTAGEAYTITFSTPYTYNGGNLLIGVYNTVKGSYNKVEWYGTSNQTSGVSAYGNNSSSLGSVGYNAQAFLPKTTFTYMPSTTPYISLAPNSATILTGSTETLTATYGNVSGTPSITYTSSNTSVATVSGSGTTATVTAVAPGTATITATMTVDGTPYTATCAVTVENPSYCTPNPTSVDGKGITAVTFGTGEVVNNSNSNGLPSSSPYYADYTSMVGSVNTGSEATVSITYTTGSSTYYNYGTLIWVDWNKNYTFEDSEIVFQGQSSQQSNPSGAHTLNATFTVPANQAADDYRMRIASADTYFDSYLSGTSTGAHDPCFTSTYAVCHDYTLRVVAASTDPVAITVSANPTNGGTVTGAGTYAPGTTVTLTATANEGYTFTNWTKNGVVISTNATYSFNVSTAAEYVANFTLNSYTVTLTPNPTEGGSVTFGARNREDLVYDFEDGWQGWTTFQGNTTSPHSWMHNTEYTAYDSNNNLIVPECHNSSEGMMLSESYISAATSGGSGTAVTPDNYLVSPQFRLGGSITFYAASRMSNYPAEKFSVLVSESGNNSASYFTHTELTVTLTSNSWNEYTIDLSAYSGMGYVAIRHYDCNDQHLLYVDDVTIVEGMIDDGSESGNFNYGASCTVTATPNTGYNFVNWTENGYAVSTNPSYTFTVTGDCDLVANFSEQSQGYTVTATAFPTNGGTVTGGGTFEEGETCTLTATANTGYRFTNWTKNGVVVSTDATYTFNVNASGAYVANFEALPQYTITILPDAVEHGAVAFGRGNRDNLTYDFEDGWQGWTLLQGTNGTSPNNWMHNTEYTPRDYSSGYGHDSDGFMLSESYISGQTEGTGTAVTPDNYLVSPQVRLGGSITFWASNPNDSYGAEHFAVAVSEGNTDVNDFTQVQEWTLLAKGVRTGGTRTIVDGTWYEYTADLSAFSGMGYIAIHHFDCYDQWLLCIDDITIVEGIVDDGSVSATFYEGETCTVVATANEGYAFVNWSENGEQVSTESAYSFEVTGDRSLVANFGEVVSETMTLAQGVNWWSTNLNITLDQLKNAIADALGSTGTATIKSKTASMSYENGQWRPASIPFDIRGMYKIEVSVNCELTLTGVLVDPAAYAITIGYGNNWIGFLSSESMSVTDAFAGLNPVEGDAIRAKTGSAFYNGTTWRGALKTLEPGKGYIYQSMATGDKTFTYGTNNSK